MHRFFLVFFRILPEAVKSDTNRLEVSFQIIPLDERNFHGKPTWKKVQDMFLQGLMVLEGGGVDFFKLSLGQMVGFKE